MLPALLLSVLFFGIGWWLRTRVRTAWSWLPLATGGGLLVLTIFLKLDDSRRVQLRHDFETLLEHGADPELYNLKNPDVPDAGLFLASTTSLALHRAAAYFPERAAAVDTVLRRLADYAADRTRHAQWRRGTNWDREVFFLAHAGATLGHYQLVSGSTDYEEAFTRIATHLSRRLIRSRYKHLISRAGEDFYRPGDNAAALYVVRLHDRLNQTNKLLPAFTDWSRYLTEELYYAESRLPCAAFSETNRCHLEPTATAVGLYIAYRAMASPRAAEDDVPWREWLHYFGTTSLSPFSLTIRANMRDGREARFCDQGAYPLTCDAYEQSVGLWAAAAYGGDYTYFRLYSANVLRRWLFPAPNYAAYRPRRRLRALTRVAIRTIGESF